MAIACVSTFRFAASERRRSAFSSLKNRCRRPTCPDRSNGGKLLLCPATQLAPGDAPLTDCGTMNYGLSTGALFALPPIGDFSRVPRCGKAKPTGHAVERPRPVEQRPSERTQWLK